MEVPPSYPHGLSDADLHEAIEHIASGLTSNVNDVQRTVPLLQLGETELLIRTTDRMGTAVDEFQNSI